jgi:hypothetical protein
MCLLGRNIELNDMSGTCEARTLVWGDALPEELWPGRRELQFFRSFETLSFKYFCSTCCRDSIISLLWDRWRLLVLSIQKSATSDLLWFRNHVFDLGLFDVNVGGVGVSLRRGFSSWCDLSHYWWLSATAAEDSKLKHQPQRLAMQWNVQATCPSAWRIFSRMRSKGSRFTDSLWGSGVEGVFARRCVYVRNGFRVRAIWPCLWWVLQKGSLLDLLEVSSVA